MSVITVIISISHDDDDDVDDVFVIIAKMVMIGRL